MNFNQPQRQSLVGVLVMFTDTFQRLIRGLWPILVIWLFKFNELNKAYVVLGTGSLLVLVAIVAYLQYQNFTFYIDDKNDEFIIQKGVLNKTRIAIKLDKIQQVTINQSFVQKVIGVYALDIDTAGTQKKEAVIRAVSHELAQALKIRLLEGEKNDQKLTDNTDQEAPFIKISFSSLVKIGLTSNYMRSFALLLAFVGTVYENAQSFMRANEIDDSQVNNYIDERLAMFSISIIIIIFLSLFLLLNLVRTIIKYFDFKITKQNRSLLLSYGLLNTKNTIIRPEKVQIVSTSRNFLQKKMDTLNLKIRQASGNADQEENDKQAIHIPGCNTEERDKILTLLFHKIPEEGVMLRPNIRRLIVGIVIYQVVPLIILFLFYHFSILPIQEYLIFVPLYITFTGLLLYFGFRNNRLFVTDEFIICRKGVWDIEHQIIEPHKIQAIATSQLFWHKSANIGSITLYTAGGTISFHLGDFTKIKELVNVWLYQVETTPKNWM
ncbi:PH domain-containing protein [Flavobacterium cerinum]|uniref:PH domain-containing protein n=1 Tax=Flavobacterium cerinum TaxID=2502784 RepID=A0ABY5IPH7_9FLAO|nr:PH domain-containing protein [Flavobacterium cerinum]UUC44664.1 PH domain-containing protein [Flavobacterium cerinum]